MSSQLRMCGTLLDMRRQPKLENDLRVNIPTPTAP
jgi:hypothetical protein